MPVPVGHEQLSRVFFLFFIRNLPRVKTPTKSQITASIAFECQKKVGLASHRYHGRKKVNRYERAKKLQTASHLWVSMHMQFGFRVVLHLPFSFSRRVQAIARFLLCRSFSVCHLVNGIIQFPFQKLTLMHYFQLKKRA